ncbi:phage head-tail connector protein [Latilactobacillus fragifolii]|uniref:phage head-tail connector protein n=1 Tax=Latilactobacillus fragifolii TaxID=2814244 RepID=UPI001ABA2738|nr:phage head-tail connector protein [Latilactobacillus fragifolii]
MENDDQELLNSIKTLLNIKDDIQDELLSILIEDSKNRLIGYIGQDSLQTIEYPTDLDWITRELTIRRFNRIGDEGKTSSSENDMSASWIENDILDYSVYLDKFRKKNSGKGIARFY